MIKASNNGCDTTGVNQYETKLKEHEVSHKKEMEKKSNTYANESSGLKNKIKSMERENLDTEHKCEKLEMTLEFEKRKFESERRQYEERLNDKANMVKELQDRLHNMAYEFNGERWSKILPKQRGTVGIMKRGTVVRLV